MAGAEDSAWSINTQVSLCPLAAGVTVWAEAAKVAAVRAGQMPAVRVLRTLSIFHPNPSCCPTLHARAVHIIGHKPGGTLGRQ